MSFVAEETGQADVSDVARRIEDTWDEWKPEAEWPELSATAVAARAAVALCIAAGIYFATQRIRHVKIRRI